MKEIKVKLTFLEPILGTSPANPDIYREFIGSHAPDAASVEDEVAALGADAVAEKAMTIGRKSSNVRRICLGKHRAARAGSSSGHAEKRKEAQRKGRETQRTAVDLRCYALHCIKMPRTMLQHRAGRRNKS